MSCLSRELVFAVVGILIVVAPVEAQRPGRETTKDIVTKLESRFEPASVKPGDTVNWTLTMVLKPGWHTYPVRQTDPNSSNVTTINVNGLPGLSPVGEVIETSEEKSMSDPDSGKPLRLLEGTVIWQQKFRVTEQAANGTQRIVIPVRFQVCDDSHCLSPTTEKTQSELSISGAGFAPRAPVATPQAAPPREAAEGTEYKAVMAGILGRIQKQDAAARSDLWRFLLTAMFWGGVTLFTPCVFPMIPITVSFFLKKSEKNSGNPVVLALVYCATIVVVLGGASLTLLGFFQALSVHPITNVLIGLLFVVLALSLFGMFDLTLPQSLTRFTSEREGQGGVIGTIFMALTFTVVSFTCVAPFLGGFSAMASNGQYSWPELIVAALAFSSTFAAPFFLLALFPSLIRKLPKSGGWLHTVKVVMAFVELAAGLKFFRTAELILLREPVFFTYDLVLSIWVALCLVCGLYLLKMFHIGADDLEEPGGPSVVRFLIGCAFISLGFYFLPGLLPGGSDGGNHRPSGSVFAWVDSFLLPDPIAGSATGELKWTANLKQALEDAKADRLRSGQPGRVFIDFTGKTCTNCKINERSVFTRPEVKELFKNYRLVQLFTDQVPDELFPASVRSTLKGTERQQADADVNRWFQEQAFGTLQLPLYVVLEPRDDGTIEVRGIYDEGRIINVGNFVEFLRSPKTQS